MGEKEKAEQSRSKNQVIRTNKEEQLDCIMFRRRIWIVNPSTHTQRQPPTP